MAAYQVRLRPPLRRGVTIILAGNALVYLAELIYAYLVDFRPIRVAAIGDLFGLSAHDLLGGQLWQLVTHMWVHDPDNILHILFNLVVLYFFGPTLEMHWGTRRFLVRYFIFGAGSAVLIVVTGLIWGVLFGGRRPPTVGASGAIAGLIAAYCILHWTSRLRVVFFELSGRGLLILFIVIDVVRLVLGEPLAVEGHWGGMITAAILLERDRLRPGLLWLRFKRWRLKRRLRLERGGKSNGDSRMLH